MMSKNIQPEETSCVNGEERRAKAAPTYINDIKDWYLGLENKCMRARDAIDESEKVSEFVCTSSLLHKSLLLR